MSDGIEPNMKTNMIVVMGEAIIESVTSLYGSGYLNCLQRSRSHSKKDDFSSKIKLLLLVMGITN